MSGWRSRRAGAAAARLVAVLAAGLVMAFISGPLPAAASRTPALVDVRPDHPRVWLTPSRLARMQQSRAAGSPRWSDLQAAADRELGSPSDEALPNLALVGLLTGDAAYCAAAIQVMLAEAVPENTLSGDSFYGVRSVLPDVSAAYDWCYGAMTAAQRAQIAGWLMDRADAVWPETSPDPNRGGGWAVNDPANNYYYGFLMSWVAALAVHGDDARAAGHVQLGLAKFQNGVRSYTDFWGRGGLFSEGTNYDSTYRLALVLDAHLTATGEDLVNLPGFNFLRESILWRVNETLPTNDYQYPLGDQSRESLAPLSDYDRQRTYTPALDVAEPSLRAYARAWLDGITYQHFDWTYAWQFIFYDDTVAAQDYGAALPTWYVAAGTGVVVRRSAWNDPAATWWAAWAGPLAEGHQDRDVNGFMLYKSGWLAGSANIWSHSGIESDTVNHNNYTFGGRGQSYQDGAGSLLKQDSAGGWTYFAGQGAKAYDYDPGSHSWVRVATDYVRKIAYLNPDLMVVYDRVTLVDPGVPKELHLHSQQPIATSGRSFVLDPGTGRFALYGTSVLPTAGVSLATSQVHLGSGGALSSYRLDETVATGSAADRILNVLQAGAPGAGSGAPVRALAVEAGEADGVEVGAQGGSAVVLGRSELVGGTLRYRTEGDVAANLVTDLLPSTGYQLSAADSAGHALRTASLLASAQGTVSFAGAAGERVFTLAPTAGPYNPLPPVRILDTRQTARLGPNSTLDVQVGGVAGVPVGAGAAALNVTVTNASNPSYVTVFPAGTPIPAASNVNFRAGQQIANLAQVALGSSGRVSIYNSEGSADVLLDVNGWYDAVPQAGTAGLFKPLDSPSRVLDTRNATGGYSTPFGPNVSRELDLTAALPDQHASAVVLNLTAVNGSEPSYLTAYPAGGAGRPEASNVNFPPGRNLPNRVVVKLSAGRRVALYNSEGRVDVVADMAGWFTDGGDPGATGGLYHPGSPLRVLDTRPQYQVGPYGTPFGPGAVRQVAVTTPGAQAAAANVTVTNPTAGSFLTVYPASGPLPPSSDLNFGPYDTLPNFTVGRLSDGRWSIYNNLGSTDVLVDVAGWYG